MSCITKKYTPGSYYQSRGTVEEALCTKRKFQPEAKGTPFNISRPGFRAGTMLPNTGNVPLPKNRRTGLGNYSISRNNFLSPPIRGRDTLDFDKLQAQEIENAGMKVQIGDSTLEKLFKIQVNDPTDVSWIEEKKRRLANGETEEQIEVDPPLGRQQRKVSKMTNFGQQNLSLEDKLEQMKTILSHNGADNRQQKAQTVAELASLAENIQKMSYSQINEMRRLVAQLKMPSNYKQAGLTKRLYTVDDYKEDNGLINLFILSNTPKDRNINSVIESFSQKDENQPPTSKFIPITSILQGMRSTVPQKILDIESKSLLPRPIANKLALQIGEDIDGDEQKA